MAVAAVKSFTFEAGLSSSSGSRENTTAPSSRLRTITVMRAFFRVVRSITDSIVLRSASRSAERGEAA